MHKHWGVQVLGGKCLVMVSCATFTARLGSLELVPTSRFFPNTCQIVWTSALKVAISCHIAVIPRFIDCVFALLAICLMRITLLMPSVMVLMLSSS